MSLCFVFNMWLKLCQTCCCVGDVLSDKIRHFPGMRPLWNFTGVHKPRELVFLTHIQCSHSWVCGFMVVLKPVMADVGSSSSPLDITWKTWNQAFIHLVFKNCPPSTMSVTVKKQWRQNRYTNFRGLKVLYRVEMQVFLACCLLFFFLLIYHGNKFTEKVHFYIPICVQRGDSDNININIHFWLSFIG